MVLAEMDVEEDDVLRVRRVEKRCLLGEMRWGGGRR